MTAIPHAGLALTSALDRFGSASSRALGAVTGGDDGAVASAFVDMSTAKVQAVASIAMIRFSDQMYKALLDMTKEREEA